MIYSTVAELLADPARWTQGHAARKEDGHPVGARDARACRWCLLGAIEFVYIWPDTDDAMSRAAREAHAAGGLLSNWNDAPGRTHAEVVDICRRASI